MVDQEALRTSRACSYAGGTLVDAEGKPLAEKPVRVIGDSNIRNTEAGTDAATKQGIPEVDQAEFAAVSSTNSASRAVSNNRETTGWVILRSMDMA